MSFVSQGGLLAGLFLSLFAGAEENKIPKIQFLNEQIIKSGSRFQGLPVGGISGASYDHRTQRFFFLSDDKKNHRFYEMRLKSRKPYRLEITKQIFLREGRSSRLKRNMDPEALVYDPGRQAVFVASEGQQIFFIPEGPQIYRFQRDGLLQRAWPIPPVFWDRKRNFGPKPNRGFESLALDSKNQILWTATEESLRQDRLSPLNQWIRISGFSLKSRKLAFQHGYRTKNPSTGLVEMLLLRPWVFLTLEREYIPSKRFPHIGSDPLSAAGKRPARTTGLKSSSSRFHKTTHLKSVPPRFQKQARRKREGVYKLQLFLTDCKKASPLLPEKPLFGDFVACRKELLFDFSRRPDVVLDNLEAMTLGPWISSGKRLFVVASDNNFRDKAQKNQLLFFSFSSPPLSPFKKGKL